MQADVGGQPGAWQFLLLPDAGPPIRASDHDPDLHGERLELQVLAWALEALDQPSRVTLHSAPPALRRGLRFGLADWKASDWQQTELGQLVPVAHADLWQRVDRALRFHALECLDWRADAPHRWPRAPRLQANGTLRAEEAAAGFGWQDLWSRCLNQLGLAT